MLYPLIRMYDSAHKAADAVAKIKQWGITDDLISVIGPGATHAGADDGVVGAFMAAYVLKSRAIVYAREVHQGHTAVVVHAPFGTGRLVTHALNSAGPVRYDDPLAEEPGERYSDATPLSSTVGLPVLSKWRPFLGLPTLTGTQSPVFGFAQLTSGGTMFGTQLSKSATPLSSMIGLPTLTRRGGPVIGLPTLSR